MVNQFTLRENVRIWNFSGSVFRIRTEYGNLHGNSLYSVRM